MVVKTQNIWVANAPFTESTTGYPADLVNTYSKVPTLVTRTRDGVSLPRWRDIIRAGGSATTGMTGNEETLKIDPGTGYQVAVSEDVFNPTTNKWEVSVSEGSGQYPDPNVILVLNNPQISLSSATNQARSRLLDAIRQQNTHMQAGVMLGELRETIRTIGSVATKIAKPIEGYLALQNKFLSKHLRGLKSGPNGSPSRSASQKQTKRLKSKDWASVRKGLSDNWLEFSFGIRPLLADTVSLAETMARYKYDERHTKVRGYGEAQAYISSGTTLHGSLFKCNVYENSMVRERAQVILRAGLVYSTSVADFGSTERLRDLLGFKLEDFVPTVWNLLPYSFLVDYFTNVGDLLSALTTDTSAVRWVNVSEIRTRQYVRNYVGRAQEITGKSSSGGGHLGGFVRERRLISRYADGVQIPLPEFKIPGVINERGEFNQQLLNMLALLGGGKGGHR